MNNVMDGIEKIKELMPDDITVVGKWILVFVIIVIMYIIIYKSKIVEIVNPNKILDRKVKKAIEKKHVIVARLISSPSPSFVEESTCSGKYEYEINGKKYRYNAMFSGNYPRRVLHLYYDKNPRKLFTNEEYHWNVIVGIPLIIITFLPWIIGALVAWKLGLVEA